MQSERSREQSAARHLRAGRRLEFSKQFSARDAELLQHQVAFASLIKHHAPIHYSVVKSFL